MVHINKNGKFQFLCDTHVTFPFHLTPCKEPLEDELRLKDAIQGVYSIRVFAKKTWAIPITNPP